MGACVQIDHETAEVCLRYFAFTFTLIPAFNAETENTQWPHGMLNSKELIDTC